MSSLDWVVLVTTLVSIVAYGLYKSRGSNTVDRYLLAGKTIKKVIVVPGKLVNLVVR